ncbi:MAG: 50S ribosome-binding GTPase [Candidatus Riflebacteria bacterium]|nr:50S ribosome-binding GTPase [Candidatus Riflebacteria bacterium]
MAGLRDIPVLTHILEDANLLVEVRDARLPTLSAATPLPRRFREKERIVVLNKADRAEPSMTDRWVSLLARDGVRVIAASAISPGKVLGRLRQLLEQRAVQRRGRSLVRAAVIGFPNVGKSTLLNGLVGSARARTGDRPGITRGRQWVKLGPNVYLLDSPGAIPLADDLERRLPDQAFKLALCRILPEGRLDALEVACGFIAWLRAAVAPPELPGAAVRLLDPATSPLETLEALARSLSLLAPGGRPDTSAAARRVMVDFAAGRLGRLTLEEPPAQEAPPPAATRSSQK